MGEEIIHSNQKQIIEQVKFIYSTLGKAFKKALKDFKPEELEAIKDNKSKI